MWLFPLQDQLDWIERATYNLFTCLHHVSILLSIA